MQINPLPVSLAHLFNTDTVKSAIDGMSDEDKGTFADILTEAFENTKTLDAINKDSSTELIMGMSDDLTGLMLDMQKAELALSLALQIRNKIIDAYNEVMRMSV